MADNRIEFELAMKDEATKVLNNFRANVDSGMKDAAAATDKYGKSTQTLTQWIKEQRTEQRQHNFLFQQSREVIGAASIGLAVFGSTVGQSSAAMKNLTGGLNAGFVAFQGVNNVVGLLGGSIKALAGPWGILISVVAGAAAALMSMGSETKKVIEQNTELIRETNKLKFALEEITRVQFRSTIVAEMQQVATKMREINTVSVDWLATLMGLATFQGIVYKGVGTPEDIDKLANKMRNLMLELRKFDAETQKESESMKDVAKSVPLVTKAMMPMEISASKIDAHFKGIAKSVAAQPFVEMNAQLTNVEAQVAAIIGTFRVGISAVSFQIGNDVYAAFQRAFDGANSLFEIFMANVAASLAELAAKEAAGGILKGVMNIIAPGSGSIIDALGFHQGGSVPKAHSGAYINAPASREFPIMVRGGETVRTEGQERDLGNAKSKGGGNTVIVNFNSPVTDSQFVVNGIKKALRETGLTIDKLAVNNRSKVVLA
jgi:hypothetical protein